MVQTTPRWLIIASTVCSLVVLHWHRLPNYLQPQWREAATSTCSLAARHWLLHQNYLPRHWQVTAMAICSMAAHPWRQHLPFQQHPWDMPATSGCSRAARHWLRFLNFQQPQWWVSATCTCSRTAQHWLFHNPPCQQLFLQTNATVACSRDVLHSQRVRISSSLHLDYTPASICSRIALRFGKSRSHIQASYMRETSMRGWMGLPHQEPSTTTDQLPYTA